MSYLVEAGLRELGPVRWPDPGDHGHLLLSHGLSDEVSVLYGRGSHHSGITRLRIVAKKRTQGEKARKHGDNREQES